MKLVNQELIEYIRKQESLQIDREEVKKQLINAGWGEKEIEETLSAPPDKPSSGIDDKKRRLKILTVSLGLILLLLLASSAYQLNKTFSKMPATQSLQNLTTMKTIASIRTKNESLLTEIERQEVILHKILHEDLHHGPIPVSKEIAVLFRMSDLLHLQFELVEIRGALDVLEHSDSSHFSKEEVEKILSDINQKHEKFSIYIKDETHDSTLDAAWLVGHHEE